MDENNIAVLPLSACQVQIHENHHNCIKTSLNFVTYSKRNPHGSWVLINLRNFEKI